MNFLAHCLIPDRAASQAHADLIAGGFLGDFLKGPVPDSLPADLQTGVRLHRRIDAYSNLHPGIRDSCRRFPGSLRRLAPAFVDVVADHLLARHWQRFHPSPLASFTARAYRAIEARQDELPAAGQRFFRYMSEHDLLARYRDPATMHQALRSVTRRLRRSHLDDELARVVDAELADLEADFLTYFPDLIAHAAGWLETRGP